VVGGGGGVWVEFEILQMWGIGSVKCELVSNFITFSPKMQWRQMMFEK